MSAKQERFVEICTQERRAKLADHFLHKIKECVDWGNLRDTIRRRYKKNKNATGNPAYDPIMLFKTLLLEQWYQLSDYQAEERNTQLTELGILKIREEALIECHDS